MHVNTKFLGSIEVEQNNIISFEQGLPGFAGLHDFVLLPVEGNPALNYLQSVQEANVCFILMNPFLIVEDYEIDISEEAVELLKIEKAEDINLFAVLTVTDNIKDITANLAAPVIVNASNNKARQEILSGGKYEIRYKLYREE